MSVEGRDSVGVGVAPAVRRVTNGNIHAPVLMLAEKAADLILGRKPLDPIDADFYRHGVHPADAGTV
ncbi:choline dehydrogenase, partial [Micrococcus sp. SIMBA_131]